ncbi:hypothetical protein SAMD00019534_082290 [Acytostelium subglobosum LB1]|uniref:hypothetical protein n=1 Tax=Acytostelium subglobosum LB1 TaxID=1410327 RepID=UPI000644F6C3|nr:hypothetical protein SAMD00019534_082290 [Acytostelium subglobosum LB1]GAM25054.1 hypothetical protein SAMD00019534_082290 [Acytostelium subglobosum LB1]|eukprot:XP_012752143.1 hypothetical protein SAMD00019534_082290 [Acytostelium subglobosum LB1]
MDNANSVIIKETWQRYKDSPMMLNDISGQDVESLKSAVDEFLLVHLKQASNLVSFINALPLMSMAMTSCLQKYKDNIYKMFERIMISDVLPYTHSINPIYIDYSILPKMKGINITLFDLALAYIRVSSIPSLFQYTYFLVKPRFMRMVQNSIIDDGQQLQQQQKQLLAVYVQLLVTRIDHKDYFINITEAFGMEQVESDLVQWFLSENTERTIEHTRKLKYLQCLPNTSSSQLLINHKQDVIKFIQGCGMMYISFELSTVFAIALEDPTRQQANQILVLDMFEWKLKHHSPTDSNSNTQYFKSLLPLLRLIEPSDRFLQLYNQLPDDIKCQAMDHLGPSFQSVQFYKDHLEQITLNALSTQDDLVILAGVAKLFGSLGECLDIWLPIMDRVESMSINPAIIVRSNILRSDAFNFATGLLGLVKGMGTILSDLQRDNYINTAIHSLDNSEIDFKIQDETLFINTYRPWIERYIAKFKEDIFTQELSVVGPFKVILVRHSMLDNQLISRIIKRSPTKNGLAIVDFLYSCPDPIDAWTQWIDTPTQDDLGYFSQKCKVPAVIFRLLMWRHTLKIQYKIERGSVENDISKSTLLFMLERNDDFEQNNRLYNQYKKVSIARMYLEAKSSKSSPVTDLFSSLSPLLIRHIIEHILTSRNDTLEAKWMVSLSTVSTRFHQAVSSILSNNVTSVLYHSMINHIGSKYCLLSKPPLHIHALNIHYIPLDHIQQCLERLESLVIPFDFEKMEGQFVFIKVHAPNLRQVLLMETPYNAIIHFGNLSQHSQELYSIVELDYGGTVSDYHRQCFNEIFRIYVDDHPSLQGVEIHSSSPAGPPALPKHHDGTGNITGPSLRFTWDLGSDDKRCYSSYYCYGEHQLSDHLKKMDESALDHIAVINLFEHHPTQSLCKARLRMVVTDLDYMLPLIPAPGTSQTLQTLEVYIEAWKSIAKHEINNTIQDIIDMLLLACADRPNLTKITVEILEPRFVYLSFYRCCPKCPLIMTTDKQSMLNRKLATDHIE